MPNQAMGALQRILNDIAAQMDAGAALLHPVLMGYIAFFGALALVWVAYALLYNGRTLESALGLLIRLTIIGFAVDHWPWFLDGVSTIGVNLGLLATGNQVDAAQFLDPGALLKLGIDSGAVLWRAFQNNLGWTSMITGLAYLIAWLGYVAAFMVMAYKVFWWQVELLLASLGGMVLLPTLIFRPTGFIAAGVLSYAANMGVRFFLGALLTGALWANLATLTAITRPTTTLRLAAVDFTVQEAFFATGVAIVLGACFLAVNRLAGMLTSGIPGMAGGQSMGSFLRMVTAGATTLLAGGAAAGAAGVGTLRLGAAGAQGALGASQAAGHLLTSGGASGMGDAVRQIYAGAAAQMSGGAQARLGAYMGSASQVTRWGAEQALGHYMGSRHGRHDEMHRGVHR
jgi:type IV secretory pathway TrbL component